MVLNETSLNKEGTGRRKGYIPELDSVAIVRIVDVTVQIDASGNTLGYSGIETSC